MPTFAEDRAPGTLVRSGGSGLRRPRPAALSASVSGLDTVLRDLKPKHTFCFGEKSPWLVPAGQTCMGSGREPGSLLSLRR